MGNLQNSYVKLDKVSKIYKMGEVEIRAVDNISFEISKGEFVVVVSRSESPPQRRRTKLSCCRTVTSRRWERTRS